MSRKKINTKIEENKVPENEDVFGVVENKIADAPAITYPPIMEQVKPVEITTRKTTVLFGQKPLPIIDADEPLSMSGGSGKIKNNVERHGKKVLPVTIETTEDFEVVKTFKK